MCRIFCDLLFTLTTKHGISSLFFQSKFARDKRDIFFKSDQFSFQLILGKLANLQFFYPASASLGSTKKYYSKFTKDFFEYFFLHFVDILFEFYILCNKCTFWVTKIKFSFSFVKFYFFVMYLNVGINWYPYVRSISTYKILFAAFITMFLGSSVGCTCYRGSVNFKL